MHNVESAAHSPGYAFTSDDLGENLTSLAGHHVYRICSFLPSALIVQLWVTETLAPACHFAPWAHSALSRN